MTQALPKNLIEFNRPKKYQFVRVLGNGACGKTLQVRDTEMNVDLVIKKFEPSIEMNSAFHTELLDRFQNEARILFNINHPNIVRVFNYFDYRNSGTSYIVMELIRGSNISDFIENNPSHADKIFETILGGFVHLEIAGILHRDLRPQNILITDEGEPKIIDFGFGKNTELDSEDIGKSISLNLWCEPPLEFSEGKYDFQTEIYFLGKLFQAVVKKNSNLADFKYLAVVQDMCKPNRDDRPSSFSDVWERLTCEQFEELSFAKDERAIYANFSDDLMSIFYSISPNAKYHRNTDEVMNNLEILYKDVMLETKIYAPNKLASIFVNEYRYHKNNKPQVANLKDFINMLKDLSGAKKNIVLRNILTRLDSINKAGEELDDIPF